MRQDESGKKCLGTLRALLLGSNMRGCSADEPIGSEIGRIFARRKLDVLALFETKLSGRGDSKLCVAWGWKWGVEEGWGRESVASLRSVG